MIYTAMHRRQCLISATGVAGSIFIKSIAWAATPRLTIELRNLDGSTLTTLRLYKGDKTWIDINNENSPLNAVGGSVDDSAYNQLHCMDGEKEIVRLANCNWDTYEGASNAGFCYGCKIGFEREPRWYCTGVEV